MQTETQPRVISTGTTFVQPVAHVQPFHVRCSAVENLCARVHHSVSFFFPIRQGADVDQIYADMRDGLRRTIYEQPIIGGVLRTDERGAFSVELQPAPYAGVAFHFSDASKDYSFPSFAELEARGFPFADGDRDGLRELRPDPFPCHEDGEATFVAKITHVRGGIVWVASLSHLITDLAQGREIMLRWAHHTKEITNAKGRALPLPRQYRLPNRDRLIPKVERMLEPEELKEASKSLGAYMFLDPTDPEKLLADIDSIFVKAVLPPNVPAEQATQLMTPTSGIWRFTPAQVNALKEVVKAKAPKGARLSTFDIVTAFVWQRFYLAKRGTSTRSPIPRSAQIVTALNVRGRLNPPLPPNFLGACVDLVRCTLDEDKLLPPTNTSQENMQNIANVAGSLRAFGTQFNEAEYMRLLALSLQTPFCPGLVPKGPIDMLVTDHAMFADGLAADWGGELGRPVALREPYIERETPRGEVIIFPRQPNGDLDVCVSAEEVVLQRLLADGVFQAACDNVFLRHDVVGAFNTLGMSVKARL
ncbi:hypothetical protein EJ05DRAFT_65114 [Pseudovirgaria hyperparasitica]|uniref:Trichothecene 3-O-acetyltransferase n=1 Tax=Pseudovirgaria hyperparasitica TaxID=470096 RepID=A0A6A6W393_9PEZI|nr:uncharacterized protein EJ05DRAFT_65114 [Pseudovirgaria hyperparasitica]KAF2756446.1 hypothetical protein EJ05DRAFT_65114 [Pseudovirgaria hyperparasitica]